ncbi:MAG: hypothetical protein CVV27_03925 [Candidatus Melainabacteria bacterium HGW-Melainabacteria-1]|nr:MAG: hypothetical protein CVV27_03925 [Candidatus Melainabacteria bacterium HGW-Melainabacteria-1]
MPRFRLTAAVILLSLVVGACAPGPAPSPSRPTVQSLAAMADQSPPVSLTRQQYIELTAETIREELAQGSETGLQAYLDWGRSQPEPYAGARNAVGQMLIQALRAQRTDGRSQQQIQSIEAMLRTPVKAVAPEGYKPINFALDQGVHKSKLAEWWYYTGHLNTPDGTPYGYEICYFRVAPVIYFAHVAVTDEKNQRFTYERNFYKPNAVEFATERAKVKYGPVASDQTGPFAYSLDVPVGGKYHLLLNLEAEKAPLIINGDGLIDMPEGQDSYYYSLTRLKIKGTLVADGRTQPVTGQGWMDHQWGHFYALRIGWDWFSFQMEDGSEYNLFGFRKRNGEKLERYVNAMLGAQPLHGRDFRIERLKWWRSPKTGRNYVTQWRVTVPQTQEVFEVEAVQPDQEVASTKLYDIAPTYWEGRCRIVKVRPDGSRVQGLGYIEHFDYTRQITAD